MGAADAFGGLTVEAARARIAARNGELNAVLRPLEAPPVPDGPLAGVPYVLKDTWDVDGVVTTGGSWRHRDRVPSSSSHAYRALAATGAVLLGRSNLCDLAFSAESDNHLLGRGRPVRNPVDPSRTAGGSTGGGAAAVADGMAAFDWGTDFGGSIRGPAAFCGIVGLRLSARTWPVEDQHFPRIPPSLWDLCGMGPLARNVEGARAVVNAVRASLRRADAPVRAMSTSRVALYGPDRAHRLEWPTFEADAARLLEKAGVGFAPDRELPRASEINALFTQYLAANFVDFMKGDELPFREGLAAVLLSLLSGGRLDKRVHPNTAWLLAGTAAFSLRHRDRAKAARARQDLLDAAERVYRDGTLIVAPTTTQPAPRHGRTAFATKLMTFCKLGNLLDATAIAIPFGTFSRRSGPPLPRSLQILGPPGSEDAVMDLATRLLEAQRR